MKILSRDNGISALEAEFELDLNDAKLEQELDKEFEDSDGDRESGEREIG